MDDPWDDESMGEFRVADVAMLYSEYIRLSRLVDRVNQALEPPSTKMGSLPAPPKHRRLSGRCRRGCCSGVRRDRLGNGLLTTSTRDRLFRCWAAFLAFGDRRVRVRGLRFRLGSRGLRDGRRRHGEHDRGYKQAFHYVSLRLFPA
jgi:hypothetical protein